MEDNVNIHLENRYAATWRQLEHGLAKIWLRGSLFLDGRFYRGDDSFLPFSKIKSILKNPDQTDLNAFFNELNGFFAVVVQNERSVFAAVDRVRSIPLFYGVALGKVFLSDDAEWVRKRVGDVDMDPVARQEFLCTGYVTGQETLFPRIRQLQAGELLLIIQGDKGPLLQTHRYYQFLHTEPTGPDDEKALLAELDSVSEKCIHRLIEYANGRQIVAPLSAGNDSRLIVTLLRRLGYENVLTFSYGVPGNHQSSVSKAVAASLKYPWEFVKYSNKLWGNWWNSNERREYQEWASGWTSLPHVQDWPAVWELKKEGRIINDVVFTPGHSADLLAGSRSRAVQEIYQEGPVDEELVITGILRYHYSLFDWESREHILRPQFSEKIMRSLGQVNIYKDNSSVFEAWDISERQAKFIINSVRVYEFWGFDWYLPLWDYDFIAFWERIRLRFRVNKSLYNQYVNQLYQDVAALQAGFNLPYGNSKGSGKLRAISTKATEFLPRPAKARIASLLTALCWRSHPLAIYGRYPEDIVRRLLKKGCTSNGIAAFVFLKELACRS